MKVSNCVAPSANFHIICKLQMGHTLTPAFLAQETAEKACLLFIGRVGDGPLGLNSEGASSPSTAILWLCSYVKFYCLISPIYEVGIKITVQLKLEHR